MGAHALTFFRGGCCGGGGGSRGLLVPDSRQDREHGSRRLVEGGTIHVFATPLLHWLGVRALAELCVVRGERE